jgi:hypothetical protein
VGPGTFSISDRYDLTRIAAERRSSTARRANTDRVRSASRWEGGQTCPYASSSGVGRERDASLRVIVPTSPARACVSRPRSEGRCRGGPRRAFFGCRGVAFFGCPRQKKKQNKTQQMSRQSHNFRDRKRAKVENRLKPNLLT